MSQKILIIIFLSFSLMKVALTGAEETTDFDVNNQNSFLKSYNPQERAHIKLLTQKKMIDFSQAHNLDQQLHLINQNSKFIPLFNLEKFKYHPLGNSNIIYRSSDEKSLLDYKFPLLVTIPEKLYPDKKLTPLQFYQLLESETHHQLTFDFQQILFLPSQAVIFQHKLTREDYQLSGDIQDHLRLAELRTNFTPADEVTGIPGKFSCLLAWQVDPFLIPLRIHWKTSDASWKIQSITMSPVDTGASYERNVSPNGYLEQQLKFISPDHLVSNTKTKLKGTLNIITAMSPLEINLPIPPAEITSTKSPWLKINNWKQSDQDSDTAELDFTVTYPSEILHLNTADLGLITPVFFTEKNVHNTTTQTITEVKVRSENIDPLNNQIHWKYRIPVKNILSTTKNENLDATTLILKIPHLISRNTVKFELTVPYNKGN